MSHSSSIRAFTKLLVPRTHSRAEGVKCLPLSTTEGLAAHRAGAGSDCLGSNQALGSPPLLSGGGSNPPHQEVQPSGLSPNYPLPSWVTSEQPLKTL